jgi:hypothetical protein
MNDNTYPVITLYQPWATWIMRGWKTIETRTHNRFACLEGQTILIHAGQKTDETAARNPYLTQHQILLNPDEMVNGFILGSVFVGDFRLCTHNDEQKALIECETKRYGLFLEKITPFKTPIPQMGQLGIWYFDMDEEIKVKKPSNQNQSKLF